MNNDGSTTMYGGMLNEVVISSNHSSGGYGYSSSGGFSSNGYLNDPYFMNSQFWDGSGYGSSGGGGGYYVSPTYVSGSWSIGCTSSGGSSSVLPTDCIFQSMAYLGSMYGETSFNFNSMKSNYNSLYNSTIASGTITSADGGVDAYLMPHFVDQYFNRSNVPNNIPALRSFIDAGGDNFAIATYDTGSSSGHAIVITGFNAARTQFTGRDAQNGIDISIDINLITGFVAIIGVCH